VLRVLPLAEWTVDMKEYRLAEMTALQKAVD
jgi:hypothetical protein